MKKSLLAMALVSAFAAPAFAQNVEVYGVVDVGVEHVDNGTTTVTDMKSGMQSDSRIGFKGGENLGGGLKAEFLVESGLDMTNGTNSQVGTLFGRQSWVGLTSDTMGSVRLGRQMSTLYTTAYAVDPGKLGVGSAWRGLNGASFDGQVNSAVTYTTPSFGGFKGEVQYGFGGQDKESDNRTLSLGGSYTAGPLMLTAVHSKQNGVGGVGNVKDTMVGGTYDLQQLKLHASWSETKEDAGKAQGYMLGVSAPMGKGTVLASWAHNKVDGVSSNSDAYSVGYTYGLSKRTNVYGAYTYVSNETNAAAGGAVVDGKDVSRFGVGVRHSF